MNLNIHNYAHTLAFSKNTKASFCYFNDLHGQNMYGINEAIDKFREKQNPKNDNFVVTSGDNIMGSVSTPLGKFRQWTEFFNEKKLDVAAVGNHELEISGDRFAEEIKKSNFKYLTCNLNFKEKTELYKLLEKDDKLAKSCIINKNGNDYGFIGVAPLNLAEIVNDESKINKEMSVMDAKASLRAIRSEVEKLSKKTNKIIVLSHGGYEVLPPGEKEKILFDKMIAETIPDIDIIFSGHSHEVFRGLKKGVNLFMSPKDKPVVLAEAGREGTYSGVLNTEFDEDGIIQVDKTTNKIKEAKCTERSELVTQIRKDARGKPIPVGTLQTSLYTGENPRKEENKVSLLVADAMRYATGAELAFINGGNIKGNLIKGELTDHDVDDVIPHSLDHLKVKLSEKDVVDALNLVAESFKMKGTPRPGLLQCSGLEYSISKKGKLLNASVVKKDGTKQELNIKNPSTTTFFTTALNTYLAKGKLGFNSFNQEGKEVLEYYKMNKYQMTLKYLKEQFFDKNKSIPAPEDRITVLP